MAKKAIGKLKTGATKAIVKVIAPTKSPKTGAYIFEETFVPTNHVQAFLTQRTNL